MMAQKFTFPISGNYFQDSSLLKSTLFSYSQAVKIKLVILNSFLSTASNILLASPFFSGIISTASPPFLNNRWNNPTISWGWNPMPSRSGHTMQSYCLSDLLISSKLILKELTFFTSLLWQFFTMFLITSSLKSHIVTSFASVHFLNATPARPTPALNTSTSLSLNLSLQRMTYLETITSMSHNLSPYNS